MIAEKNNVVSIVYELRSGSKEGEVVESLNNENPLTFLFGTGGLLPKFEENLSGLTNGDGFEFELGLEDAYGPVVENAIVQVPQTVFEVDGKIDESLLQVGSTVPMMDSEGRRLNGKVMAIEGDAVKMDFNHPMAGNDLVIRVFFVKFFNHKISQMRFFITGNGNSHFLSFLHQNPYSPQYQK